MKINWSVRFKNKLFWVTLIPAVTLLLTQLADLFGYKIDLSVLTEKLILITGSVFAILGIVVDFTTKGLSDSEQALEYETPKG